MTSFGQCAAEGKEHVLEDVNVSYLLFNVVCSFVAAWFVENEPLVLAFGSQTGQGFAALRNLCLNPKVYSGTIRKGF